MNIRYVLRNLTGLLVALFFIGSAQAQTYLHWDSNGNLAGSSSQAQWNQLSRDLTAYNKARNAGAITSATVAGGEVAVARAATLTIPSSAGLGKAATLAVQDIVKHPLASVGKGVVGVMRLTPTALVGTVAATVLLDAGISYVDNQWMKAPAAGGGNYWYYGNTQGATQQELCTKFNGTPYSFVVWKAEFTNAWRCHAYYDQANGGGIINSINPYPLSRHCASGISYVPTSPTDDRCGADPVAQPVTDQQVVDAISSGLTSNPSRAPDVLKAIFDKGGWVPLDAVDKATWTINPNYVEGAPQVETTTSTAQDGSTLTTTKTTTPRATATSSGDTVTNNTITYNITNNTTTITRDQAGNIVSQSSSSEDTTNQAFQDAAMPGVPKLYEQKYPDGIAGVWQANKPDITNTQFYSGIKSMFPSFGGGQCPVWGLSFNLGAAGNFGSGNFNVPCWIFQALGLVTLATAAFTARKILF